MLKKILEILFLSSRLTLGFGMISSCVVLCFFLGSKGVIWVGNELEKQERNIELVTGMSSSVFLYFVSANLLILGLDYAHQKITGEAIYPELPSVKTPPSCRKCKYYDGNLFLPCAVNPELPQDCKDFITK